MGLDQWNRSIAAVLPYQFVLCPLTSPEAIILLLWTTNHKDFCGEIVWTIKYIIPLLFYIVSFQEEMIL